MQIRPEGRHFAFIWYVVIVLAFLATPPLALWPVNHWLLNPVFAIHMPAWYPAHDFAMAAFCLFWGAEISAADIKDGLAGTMTNFTFLRVPQLWLREVLAVWYSGLIAFEIAWPLGLLFGLWLPRHYWYPGATGPVDWFARWVGKKLMARFPGLHVEI